MMNGPVVLLVALCVVAVSSVPHSRSRGEEGLASLLKQLVRTIAQEEALSKRAGYDTEMEQRVRVWMEKVMGEPLVAGVPQSEPLGPDRLQQALKSGVYLCKLAEKVTGSKTWYSKSGLVFKQMENIGKFKDALVDYGVSRSDLFQIVDLSEKQNMAAVVQTIYALARKAGTL